MTTKIKSTIPGAALPGYPAFPWLPPFLVQVVAVDSVPNKGISYRMYLCAQHTFKHPRGCFHVNKPFCGCMCVDLRGKKQQIFFCCFKKEKKNYVQNIMDELGLKGLIFSPLVLLHFVSKPDLQGPAAHGTLPVLPPFFQET